MSEVGRNPTISFPKEITVGRPNLSTQWLHLADFPNLPTPNLPLTPYPITISFIGPKIDYEVGLNIILDHT